MKQKCYFHRGVAECKQAATSLRSYSINTTLQGFQKRYITLLYLKGLKSYQLSKFKCLHFPTFLSKSDFSFALFMVTFEPLEIQQSNIPLLKALKCGINAVGSQGCRCMSTFCHAPLKIALLLHKMANECKQPLVAVSITLSEIHFIWDLILADFWQFEVNLYDKARLLMKRNLKISEGMLKKLHFCNFSDLKSILSL